jgi:hypothetical protein
MMIMTGEVALSRQCERIAVPSKRALNILNSCSSDEPSLSYTGRVQARKLMLKRTRMIPQRIERLKFFISKLPIFGYCWHNKVNA